MQTVPRRKTSNSFQARENMQPVPIAGKHATGFKCGKIYSRFQARENMQPVPSAGICENRAKFLGYIFAGKLFALFGGTSTEIEKNENLDTAPKI